MSTSTIADLHKYADALLSAPPHWSYDHVPDEALHIRDILSDSGGPEMVAEVHHALLSHLIERSRRALHTVHPHVAEGFERAAEMIEKEPGPLDFTSDGFCKDLAVVSLRAWQVGPLVVEPRRGLARRMLYGKPMSALRAFRVVRKVGAFPFYMPHLYDRTLGDFSEAGWHAALGKVADIMTTEPEVRGFISVNWYRDPAVQHVSPRLAYLYRVPKENGAHFLRVPDSSHTRSDALLKSPTRRKLAAEGKYTPREYLMIWPRAGLLRWAAQFASPAT